MIAHLQAAAGRLPVHRCFSGLSSSPPRGGRATGSSRCRANRVQNWYTDDRRRLLQGMFAGFLGAAVMSRGGSALAASSQVSQVLESVQWPDEFPYTAEDFRRYDESPDTFFYGQPRFVTHIDDGAIASLTRYYEKVFPPSGQKDIAMLDMCSSWVSHYPKDFSAGRISGMSHGISFRVLGISTVNIILLGMNKEELARNTVLTDFEFKDLNVDPTIPYGDETFDVITNVVSVDYLSKPLQIFQEMHRVLKPGGTAIMSFSNRCFPTKAIAVWTATGDSEHAYIIGSYFHYSVAGGWTKPKAVDISPGSKGLFGGSGDPMYIVTARKQA